MAQRTGGMTAIGVLNIIFGALGALMALLIVIGGGALAAMGTAGMQDAGVDATTAGEVAGAGGLIVVIGLALLAIGVVGLVSGIGVLKMAPWGRTLSLIYAGGAIILTIINGLSTGFGGGTAFGVVYPIIVVICFMRPEWKQAFSKTAAA